MKNIVAIILARGGSKTIPKKNIKNFCGKPLVAWSILQAKKAHGISSVWVSSDSKEILHISEKYNASIILRPKKFSTSTSTSVSGWIHAINEIEKTGRKIDVVIGLQATSPVRESSDIEKGIRKFNKSNYDSMFSAGIIGDFYIWGRKSNGKYHSINYNFQKRPRRQEFSDQYVENGSFYIFKPYFIKKFKNQLSGKIGITLMEFWKSFEIDNNKDLEFCEIIMKHYLLKGRKRG